MKLLFALLLCCAPLFLLAGDAASQDIERIGPEVLTPLFSMLDDHWKGNITDAEFIRYVDKAVAQQPDQEGKAEILKTVVGQINCRLDPKHDINGLVIRYSDELVAVSDKPDVAAEAYEMNAVANERKAEAGSSSDRNAHLLSALKSWVAVSKIISKYLTQREMVPLPGVSGGGYIGSTEDTEFKLRVARHKAEKEARAIAEQQDNMVRLVVPVKHGLERLAGELNLSGEEFTKIWMEVKEYDGAKSPGTPVSGLAPDKM